MFLTHIIYVTVNVSKQGMCIFPEIFREYTHSVIHSMCYLFNTSQEKVCCIKNSDVNELKRLINSEWAALSRTIIECADGKWHQVYALAFMLEVDILTTCYNKDDVM